MLRASAPFKKQVFSNAVRCQSKVAQPAAQLKIASSLSKAKETCEHPAHWHAQLAQTQKPDTELALTHVTR